MKAFIQLLILMFLYHVPLYSSEVIIPAATSIKLNGPKSGTPKDIGNVMRFIWEGNKRLMSKETGIDRVKECIDSAGMICERKKLDVPAGLYLLEAEYCYAAAIFAPLRKRRHWRWMPLKIQKTGKLWLKLTCSLVSITGGQDSSRKALRTMRMP